MTSSWGSIDVCWCKCRVETRYDTVYYITVTSNDCHGVANHRSIECLFNSLFWLTTKKHQSSHYCPFVRGIHRWPVDSPALRACNAENVSIWWHHNLYQDTTWSMTLASAGYRLNSMSSWIDNYITVTKLYKTRNIFLIGAVYHSWWRHQMETFPRYWPFMRGIHRSPVNSSDKGQWYGALMFSLICVWTNGWVNNRGAGDLRRYRDHYDVIVMYSFMVWKQFPHYWAFVRGSVSHQWIPLTKDSEV